MRSARQARPRHATKRQLVAQMALTMRPSPTRSVRRVCHLDMIANCLARLHDHTSPNNTTKKRSCRLRHPYLACRLRVFIVLHVVFPLHRNGRTPRNETLRKGHGDTYAFCFHFILFRSHLISPSLTAGDDRAKRYRTVPVLSIVPEPSIKMAKNLYSRANVGPWA